MNKQLFYASCLSLMSAALIFISREHLGHILIQQERILTKVEFGNISGWAFKGTALALLIFSPLIDWFGLKRGMVIAWFFQVAGIVGFVISTNPMVMLISMTLAGFGWGILEVTINPLCAAQFPDQKTRMLNILHAWWPGGLIVGGLFSTFFLDAISAPWQVYMLVMLIPVLLYGILIFREKFPETERVDAGISNKAMFKTVITPGFLILLFCMSLTASAELAPGQWLETTFKEYANASGTLILVYGSAIMFILRFFAGPLAKAINPIGIMTVSCIMASIGLYMLSQAAETQSIVFIYLSATVFYLGICYMWPTMYSLAAELYPGGGGLTIGLIGFIGMLGVSVWIPQIGKLGVTYGLTTAFSIVSILPAIAFFIYLIWMIKLGLTGGYKIVNLKQE
ncbi:sugar MFS transporter [Candidatus Neomarinimicrobiota bacterium]